MEYAWNLHPVHPTTVIYDVIYIILHTNATLLHLLINAQAGSTWTTLIISEASALITIIVINF